MSVWQRAEPILVLASGSAARRAVLSAAGLRFDMLPAAVDEASIREAAVAEGATPAEIAVMLARMKAERVARSVPAALVIGADQILVCGGERFDKPESLEAARAQLRTLRGRTHTLVTAVSCCRDGAEIWHTLAQPCLRMRQFSDDFLEHYIVAEGESLLECVGAYRIEGRGVQLFDTIDGEHAAVLGLPLLPLLGFLRQHGVLLS